MNIKSVSSKAKGLTPEETTLIPAIQSPHDARRDRIAIYAYYKSEGRGFANAGELHDWLSAKRESN